MKIIRIGIYVLITMLVLSFGGVEPWGNAILEIGAALLFLLWAVLASVRRPLELRRNWLYVSVFVLGATGFVQYAAGISVYPYLTKIELLRWSAYMLLCFLTIESFRSSKHMKQFVWFLLSLGFLVSLFGILQHFTFNGKLYWAIRLSDGAHPFGPFVNPNHFAGFVELIAPLGLALLVFSSQSRPHFPVLLLFTIVPIAAVFLSASRAGIIVLLFQFTLVAFLCCVQRMQRKPLLAAIPIGFLACGMILWLGVTNAVKRFELLAQQGVSRELRVAMDQDTWRIFIDHPWTGTGLGTLIAIYPRYASFYNGTTVDHAHNDFLEVLADTGLLGGLCGAFFVAVLFRRGFANFQMARNSQRVLVGGALVSCVGLLLHSLVDFNLHIPSNALIFLLLAFLSTIEAAGQINNTRFSAKYKGHSESYE
jgi:O-antigen ligase